jgi:peptidoglycan/LPS O-acetylase OafA/YrhL
MAKRVPALDGLRGVAILLVLLTHVRALSDDNPVDHWLNVAFIAGYSGVDLFFVLSGFLITGVLLDAKHGGEQPYYRTFYIRRALRILPLYYGVVAAMVIFDIGGTRRVQWWYWLYLANLGPMLARPWAGPAHFWSLAIEEQFYLVWPFIVLWLSERRFLQLCVVGAVVAFVSRAALAAANVDALWIQYMPLTRMDTLLAGAALAVLVRRPGGLGAYVPHAKRWGPPAVIVFGALYLAHEGFGRWPGAFYTVGYSAAVVMYASALVLAVAGPIAKLLSAPVLRFFGKYSYGMYVYHVIMLAHMQPLFAVARRIPRIGGSAVPGDAFFVVCAMPLIVAIAFASWHLYEQRFLALRV